MAYNKDKKVIKKNYIIYFYNIFKIKLINNVFSRWIIKKTI